MVDSKIGITEKPLFLVKVLESALLKIFSLLSSVSQARALSKRYEYDMRLKIDRGILKEKVQEKRIVRVAIYDAVFPKSLATIVTSTMRARNGRRFSVRYADGKKSRGENLHRRSNWIF